MMPQWRGTVCYRIDMKLHTERTKNKDTPYGVPQANIKIQAAEAVSENHLVNHQPVFEISISQDPEQSSDKCIKLFKSPLKVKRRHTRWCVFFLAE